RVQQLDQLADLLGVKRARGLNEPVNGIHRAALCTLVSNAGIPAASSQRPLLMRGPCRVFLKPSTGEERNPISPSRPLVWHHARQGHLRVEPGAVKEQIGKDPPGTLTDPACWTLWHPQAIRNAMTDYEKVPADRALAFPIMTALALVDSGTPSSTDC